MATAKIQKGDSIKVIAGAYKGTTGQVAKIIRKKNQKGQATATRVAITTVPKIAKYRKANAAYQIPGMQTEVDRTIDISNVMLVTSKGQTSRVSISSQDGKKVRTLKKDSTVVTRQEVIEAEPVTSTDTSSAPKALSTSAKTSTKKTQKTATSKKATSSSAQKSSKTAKTTKKTSTTKTSSSTKKSEK